MWLIIKVVLLNTGSNQYGDKYIWMFEEEYNKLDDKQVSQIINKVNRS